MFYLTLFKNPFTYMCMLGFRPTIHYRSDKKHIIVLKNINVVLFYLHTIKYLK